MSDLEAQFDAAMWDSYRRTKSEAKYNAGLRMGEMRRSRPPEPPERAKFFTRTPSPGWHGMCLSAAVSTLRLKR